jgi:hypothetical protein
VKLQFYEFMHFWQGPRQMPVTITLDQYLIRAEEEEEVA